MAGLFASIGSILNVVTSTAQGIEEQVNGWREVGGYAVYKAQAESARDFLEELGATIPEEVDDIILLASLMKELMALTAVREKDSKQTKRLKALKDELKELAKKVNAPEKVNATDAR